MCCNKKCYLLFHIFIMTFCFTLLKYLFTIRIILNEIQTQEKKVLLDLNIFFYKFCVIKRAKDKMSHL